ncbi:two-component system, sensor histidine kinase YesM [Paenibacillus sp. UNCCL117]|uniref:cache domain-containing sensor histidine kinase n=1 Tax=unclassified Paenibacillus TaxID=185978 RepID=UPI00089092EF|nr:MULTISPECIES: sensor histidine kinase [unclassified Paenibacillus]SDC28244.1 two-component system, sensor histidine kinase YesM [Paenibacillus sp. cl123]SFW20509.1 two-component system, sensor histidine kinase YesM [Paenibacillus sp. UNCCL117]
MRGQWRIRPILLLSFISLTWLLLLFTCLIFYWNVSKTVIGQIVDNRLELIDQTHGQISSRFRDVEEIALVISSNPKLIDAFGDSSGDLYSLIQTRREVVNNLVNPFLYSKPYLSSVRLFNDRFKDLPQSAQDRVYPLSAIEWDQEPLSRSDSVWIGSHPDPVAAYQTKQVISYVRKIFNSQGRVVGLVEMNVEEQSLSQLLRGERKMYDGILLIADGGGRIMSQLTPYAEGKSAEALSGSGWLGDVGGVQQDGYRSIRIGGQNYLVLFSYPDKSQWRLIELIPTERIYGPVKQIRNAVLAIGIAGLLLTFVIAYYLSGRMTRQIPELLGAFRRVQVGKLDTKISESHAIFEYRQIALAFNRMIDELNTVIDSREREQRAAQQAEYRALENQINPHFLYNTLDMINWMAAAKGAKEASLMSAKLGRLFRLSLSRGKSLITMAEEMEHAAIYAQIQQARFKESFLYEERMTPEAAQLYVPKLIIQPLVENAIVHGFRNPTGERIFCITVSAYLAGPDHSELRIVVEDNGDGVAESETESRPGGTDGAAHMRQTEGGHGMDNVRKRIRLYYGEAYGVALSNRPEGGARAEIRLPAASHPPEPKQEERL